jgi:hypothetical protein
MPQKRMSDESVKKATGKTWAEWFKILDKAGARRMNHTEMARWIYSNKLKKGWWCQMVVVTYEQARGLRAVNQAAGGFQVSVSKMLPFSVAALYRAWTSPAQRRAWLKAGAGKDLVITTANKNKNIRAKWIDRRSTLAIDFYKKGATKTQVVVQQEKLANKAAVEKQRAFWKAALGRLQTKLTKDV